MDLNDELLSFFKALAEPSRLRMVGLLARREYSVEELATTLDLRPSTVSHHVAKLVAAGLVSGRPDRHYHLYSLDTDALEAKAKGLLASRNLHAIADSVDVDADERKVLRAFTGADGRLKQIPVQHKKFEIILRHALGRFEHGGVWSERELNEILRGFADDVATIRRGFIELEMMARNKSGSRYWRTDSPPPSSRRSSG
jgi:predicted transcriptional regulator